jgi:hypothetical protein
VAHRHIGDSAWGKRVMPYPSPMEVSGSSTNPGKLAVELAGHAYVWGQAVGLEADRALTAPTALNHHVDGYLLILAIRQVLRSADAMDKAVGGDKDLREAQARFLAEHPQAQTMRDVIIHFDEYEDGTGKLQKTGEVGPLTIWFGVGDDSVTLALASNLTVELSTASSAALALADATLSAKDRYLARLRVARSS